jgi:hypothetical protein
LTGLDDTTGDIPYVAMAGVYRIADDSTDEFPVYERIPRRPGDQRVVFGYNGTTRLLNVADQFVRMFACTDGPIGDENATFPFDQRITDWHVWNPTMSRYDSFNRSLVRPRCVDDELEPCSTRRLFFSSGLLVTILLNSTNSTSGRQIDLSSYEQMPGRYVDFRPAYQAVGVDPEYVPVRQLDVLRTCVIRL